MTQRLTVVCPGDTASERYALTLEHALKGRPARIAAKVTAPLRNQPILFAVPLDKSGVNHGYYGLLAYLRTHPGCLDGSVGGVLVDGPGDLYTKAVGRELVLCASRAGCAFPGRPLVEAAGNLRNFTVQAKNADCSLEDAYRLAARDLAARILDFAPVRHPRPRITVLHASSRRERGPGGNLRFPTVLLPAGQKNLPESFFRRHARRKNAAARAPLGRTHQSADWWWGG